MCNICCTNRGFVLTSHNDIQSRLMFITDATTTLVRICDNAAHVVCLACMRQLLFGTPHKAGRPGRPACMDGYGRVRCVFNHSSRQYTELCDAVWPRGSLLAMAPSERARNRLMRLLDQHTHAPRHAPCTVCQSVVQVPLAHSPQACILACATCGHSGCALCGTPQPLRDVHECLSCRRLSDREHGEALNGFFRSQRRTRLLRNKDIGAAAATAHLDVLLDSEEVLATCPGCKVQMQHGTMCSTLSCVNGCGYQVCAFCNWAEHADQDGIDMSHWDLQQDGCPGSRSVVVQQGLVPEYVCVDGVCRTDDRECALTEHARGRAALRAFMRRRFVARYLFSLPPHLLFACMMHVKTRPHSDAMPSASEMGEWLMVKFTPPTRTSDGDEFRAPTFA